MGENNTPTALKGCGVTRNRTHWHALCPSKGKHEFCSKSWTNILSLDHEEVVALFIENPLIEDVQIENSEMVTNLLKTLRWGLENP